MLFRSTNGTLDLNNFTFSAYSFDTNNSNTRVLAFGTTGQITLTGNNATIISAASLNNCTFTATTLEDATYMFSAMHFFKTVTKMSFGVKDPNRGSPPPVLNFSAYGDAMFRDVPVVITDFTVVYPNDVDYVNIEVNGSKINVPIKMDFTIQLAINMPINDVKNNFTLTDFANGNLIKQKKGYV